MIAANTKLLDTEKLTCMKIMQIYNEYHRLEKKTSEAFISMADKILYLDPKLGQHFLAAYHPKKQFDVQLLKEKYNILITNKNLKGYADMNDFISTRHANVLSKDSYYKQARIHVLHNSHNKEKNESALDQTGQNDPDYLTTFYESMQPTSRFQDYKVTNTTVNKGHVTLLKEINYEIRSRGLFMAYRTEYKNNKLIKDQLDLIYNEKNLTWSQRNDLAKEFLKKQFHIHSQINPSSIFKIQSDKELDSIPIDSKYSKTFQESHALRNVETTRQTLSRGLIVGGVEATQGYINDQEGCPNLRKVLNYELTNLAKNATEIFEQI